MKQYFFSEKKQKRESKIANMKKIIFFVLALGLPISSFAENNVSHVGNIEAITPGWWIAPISAVIALH